MLYFLFFIIEIVVIFFLSKKVQRVISYTLMRVFKSKDLMIYIMALLFFPGTFVHEISHFLAALFTLVPVGNMHLIPVIEEDGIRLGSVSIAKTDPIRRFVIGVAPLIMGVGVITLTFYFLPLDKLFDNFFMVLLAIYLTFTISNSMFSSKKDMEGLWVFVAIVLIMSLAFWFLGINVDLSQFFEKFKAIFKSASIFMTIPILINVMVLSLLPKRNY